MYLAFDRLCCSSQALAEALKINESVTEIKLGYNRILDEGAKAWCVPGAFCLHAKS